MSHRKTLTQLGWFKVAFCAPLIAGVIVAAIIICNDPYFSGNACLTSECLNEAVNRLKVPLTIIALIFPAVALVASNHRSAQTAAQIERTDKQIVATEAKNAFENCIKHREIIFKRLSELEERLKINFKNRDQLYSLIFIKNDYTDFVFYVDLDHFRKSFLSFNKRKSIRKQIHHMRLILKNRFHVKFITTQNEEDDENFDNCLAVAELYENIIGGLADFCLSPDGRVEILSDDFFYINKITHQAIFCTNES